VAGALGTIGSVGLAQWAHHHNGIWLTPGFPWTVATAGYGFAATAAFGCLVALVAVPVLWLQSRFANRGRLFDGASRDVGALPHRWWRAVVAFEIVVAVVLMVGAGLFSVSLHRFLTKDLGFRTRNLLMSRVDLPQGSDVTPWRIVAAVDSMPGVAWAHGWAPDPMGMARWHAGLTRRGSEQTVSGRRHQITPGALASMEIPVLRGREFTPFDTADDPRVIVIDRGVAEALWPGEEAVGREVYLATESMGDWATVVGVVAPVSHGGHYTNASVTGDIYLPLDQSPWPTIHLLVGYDESARAPVDDMVRAVRSVEAGAVLSGIDTMEGRIGGWASWPRTLVVLANLYAGIAVLLALLATYGILAYGVRSRRAELAVRSALGASRTRLTREVLARGLTPVMIGLPLGIAVATVASRFLRSMLYEVAPTNPVVYGAVGLVVVTGAAIACLPPALTAGAVEPMVELRGE